MDRLEKAMNGMACCIERDGLGYPNCERCPYMESEIGTCRTTRSVMQDALDELKPMKAQRPKLMTLEEVKRHYALPDGFPDDMDAQENYCMDIPPLYFDFPIDDPWTVHWRGYFQVAKYMDCWESGYGVDWRCWTAKPTDEQRKAAKWDNGG